MYTNIPIIVVLWQHANFTGRRVLLTADTPDLGPFDFVARTSAIGIHPGPNYNPNKKYEVSFHSEANYGGGGLVLGVGAYGNIHAPFNFGDIIRSVNFNSGYGIPGTIAPIPVVAELFQHKNYGGKKLIMLENTSNLHAYSEFGDIVSSVKVFRGPTFAPGAKAKLFRDPSYLGGSIELGEGSYPDLHTSHAFGDVVSSVKVR